MRVLDLTDERGYLCGRMLGDLGADVIKIENPAGDSGRRLGPFINNDPHPERSLYWLAYNRNKRGITLNIAAADGKVLLHKLVKTADVVIESFDLGYLDSIGSGYTDLNGLNPRVILTSISPFGQKGPYRHFKHTDIVLMAMGGYMYTCGDPDRAPLRLGFPQADLFGGAHGAVGTMMAYYHQQMTGNGQWVDISSQEALIQTSGGFGFYYLNGIALPRAGEYRVGLSTSAKQRLIWPCKDGWVTFQIFGGKFGGKSNRALVQWMDSEGFADDYGRNLDWDRFDMAQASQEIMDRIEGPIAAFFMAHNKSELEAGALSRDIVFYAVADMEDLNNSAQLKSREFWTEIEHPELGKSITYPGEWAKFSGYHTHFRRAPLIGEHNSNVYVDELGLSIDELVMYRQAGVI
ncbi:MAG: CoA transferase [Dehalococcoidia bacterium]